MTEELNEKIDAAIAKMAEQVKAQPDPQKSLHCSQAALNLAHAKSVLGNLSQSKQLSTKKID